MSNKKEVCVIVDAYSSGSFLPAAFHANGLPTVHVRNRVEEYGPYAQLEPPPGVIDVLDFDGSLEDVAKRLDTYRVSHAIAGSESGVEVADRLADLLDVSTSNGIKLTTAKREKALMVDVLRDAGIRHARSERVATAAEAHAFATAGGGYPIVLKPLQGAMTIDVQIVHSVAEAEAYFARTRGTADVWGNVNLNFLAQELLLGEEYMVDTISASGHHRAIEVWRADKRVIDGARVYDLSALIVPEDPAWQALTDYVATVLDAFAIGWGPTHAEVMLTETGPVLIELGARMHGAIAPSITLPVYGSNLALMTAAAYTAPEHFLAATERPLPHRAALAQVAMHCPRNGTMTVEPDFREVQELPSFHSLRLRAGIGPVRKTRDLLSSFGSVYLVHPRADEVQDGYREIRRLEKTVLYTSII